ncbi:MAG: response regulator transcription factor [Bacteroidales bacterium]|nr:response regulator transcription factor [Bacteroidales bacterium]
MIKVGIVDDEVLFRQGLRLIIEDSEELSVIFDVGDGDSLFNLLNLKEYYPDVILLDLKLSGISGIDIAKKIIDTHPHIKIIIISSYYSEVFLHHMFDVGVNAYLPKNSDAKLVDKAIRNVFENGFYFSDYTLGLIRKGMNGKKKLVPSFSDVPVLTQREAEVLKLICDQFSNSEIAAYLGISKRTVEGHRNRLIQKTGVRNLAGLIVYAIINKLVDVDMESIIKKI